LFAGWGEASPPPPIELRQKLNRVRQRHPARRHVREELVSDSGEVDQNVTVPVGDRANWRHAVGEQVKLAHMLVADVVGDLLDGCLHTVTRGFAGNDDDVGVLENLEEATVELTRRILRIRDFGLQGTVVFGEHIGALGDVVDVANALFAPATKCASQVGLDVVSPRADKAVGRPDHDLVLAFSFECFSVVDGPLPEFRNASCPGAILDRSGADDGHRIGQVSICVAPEGRVGDVDHLVAVECDVDLAQLQTDAIDETGEPDHVCIGTGNWQRSTRNIHEVVLRINDEKMYVHKNLHCSETGLSRVYAIVYDCDYQRTPPCLRWGGALRALSPNAPPKYKLVIV
jgi:hypothetical protein